MTGRSRYLAGYGVGAVGYAVGLALSALLDLPSGAVIVWVLAVTAVVFASLRGKRTTSVGAPVRTHA